MARACACLLLAALAGCVAHPAPAPRYLPPIGSTDIFNTEPGAAPGHRLVVADLRLEAGAIGPAHYHPWEEYLYVIEGSALLSLDGAPPRSIAAGEQVVIPARMVHRAQAGPQGVRAIVTRVHDLADPIAVPVPEGYRSGSD
jgi:quercetin dioxygenase-like cupin family protein